MSNELATMTEGSDAIQIAQHIGQIQALGHTLIKSGMLPNGVKTPEAAVAIILKGRELGIPPMQALSHIHVISGKPTLSAELMLAMVMKAGHEVWIAETSGERCTVSGKRRGSDREQTLTFTIEDAKRAGVLSNPTWKKYPDAMLRARAISAFCRMFAPDVLMGASYTPEELGASVDADGEVLDVAYQEAPQAPSGEAVPEGLGASAVALSDEGKYPPEPPAEVLEPGITKEQVTLMGRAINEAQMGREDARKFVSYMVGRDLADVRGLTEAEAARLIERWQDKRTKSGFGRDKISDDVQKWVDHQAMQAEEGEAA